jgi:hypothetical protein
MTIAGEEVSISLSLSLKFARVKTTAHTAFSRPLFGSRQPVKLISPHRRLVAHGTFKKVFVGTKAPVKVKNGHLFLFNDMLLVASEEGNMFKKASKRKFVIRSGPIAITNVLLWSGNDAEGLVFCVVRMDDSSGQITLQASSPEEKFEWISRINDVRRSPHAHAHAHARTQRGLTRERVCTVHCDVTERRSARRRSGVKRACRRRGFVPPSECCTTSCCWYD